MQQQCVLEREVKYITAEWSNGLENDNCDFNRKLNASQQHEHNKKEKIQFR